MKEKFDSLLKEIDKIHNFRQEYIIAKAETEKYKGVGFLAKIMSKIGGEGILVIKNDIYRLRRIRKEVSFRAYLPTKKLFTLEEFFSKIYLPSISNYIKAQAIKYVWETREGLINRILRTIPVELINLIVNASRSSNWFIEVGDIGLERRGDKYYLYKYTGRFALIELLDSNAKGNLYLFPNFKVAVPFKITANKIEISLAVVLDPPALHPFLPASTASERGICFGSSAQAYSNISKRGTVEALLQALEMAVIMIKDGYGHGAGPYRSASECGVKRVDYNYLEKHNIPVTNLSDPEAKELLRKKWGAKI